MTAAVNNERIFWLNITEKTIYELAKEIDIPKEKITPEIIQEIKNLIMYQFQHWDVWLQESISNLIEKQS